MSSKKGKATNRKAGGFLISEFPHHSYEIIAFGKKYIVKVTLIHIKSSTDRKDEIYLYEGTIVVNGKKITESDFSIKKMLSKLKNDIDSYFKNKK